MRNKKNKHLGIEIDPDLHFKMHYVAKFEGRSGNGLIVYLLNKHIYAFEKEYGKIELPSERED